MLKRVGSNLRFRLRTLRHLRHYPILLPHYQVGPRGIGMFGGLPVARPPAVLEAARLCDGSRTLGDIAAATGVGPGELLRLRDEGILVLWYAPLPVVPQRFDNPALIIISPHPDDASLCLGGTLLTCQPESAIVLDVFTRTAWSRFPAQLNSVGHIQSIRQAEEGVMARLTGVDLRRLGLPEAVLRQGILGVADPPQWNAEVATTLTENITSLAARYPRVRWCLPLAVGNHLDHRLVRDISLAALEKCGVGPSQLRFYEDLPYAETLGGIPDFSRIVPGHKLAPELLNISDVWRWKLELNRVYWSQVCWAQITKLGDYAVRVGGGRPAERIWKAA